MTGDLTLDYDRLRYIELRGDGSKLPAKPWGGYDQDFDAAEHVHSHEDVKMHPSDNWGVVDVEDPDHGSFALLIFDIDVHKAPEDFDVDRVSIPTDTLVTKSQNGGFHAYFIISGCERGQLNESDFVMTSDPGFDVDIRGSSVSHHVVAPADIPGIGGQYKIVNDEAITTYFEPRDAAERIQFDGEPLLEFNPDSGADASYDFDVPTEPPEDMPTCYHAGLELRKAAPDDHPNSHKVNVLTASCGLGAGYDAETVAGHFCGEWAPHDGGADLSDKEQTEYQVKHIDSGGYAPPSEQTLRDYGILDEDQHCDEDCPIEYHGPQDDSRPSLDIVSEQRDADAEAAAVAGAESRDDAERAETDGGATTDSGSTDERASFDGDVIDAVKEFNNEVIQAKTARDRIARAFCDHFDFVAPEREVRGWRETLYVYNDDEGIYEPRGEAFIEQRLEQAAGDFATNQVTNEVAEKVRRRSIARDGRFETEPHRLVVGNGILNLHTGELSPYTPTEYHRTKIDVDWNPDAGEPDAIDEFLHEIVDPSDVPTLYRLIAHSLYKEYVGEKAAMLIGSGQNGKSVFLDFVERFLGGHNVSHRSLQAFEDQFAANQLEGKLANIHPDMGDSAVKDLSTFKKLTGRDTMLADVKYESPIEFENYATLLFAANEMPAFSEDNHAVWRRWVYVDFPFTFDDDDPDAKDAEPKRVIMRRLTQEREMEALLLRCQQEIQAWFEGREWYAAAMEPDEVREKMKKASEPVFAFATACLEPGDGDDVFVRKSRVREAYNAFADAEDLPRIPENEFGERLVTLRDFSIESGQRRVDGGRPRVYENVQLSARGRQLLGLDEPTDSDDQATVDERPNKPVILQRARQMFEENGHDPIPRNALEWAVTDSMGKSKAEHVVGELLKQGDLQRKGDDCVIPT